MTVKSYPRMLQTVLDDTLGGDQRVSSFEKREDMDGLPIGVVTFKRISKQVPVFSAASLGPDISAMAVEERTIWNHLGPGQFGQIAGPRSEASKYP